MAPPDPGFQVVLLAGGECKRLYPLTSGQLGLFKAMLPVANRPLISYPLRHLSEAGIKQALVVAIGQTVADKISTYLDQNPSAAPGVKCTVTAVPEDSGAGDALRAVTHLLTSETIVVYSGDLITDVPVQALVVGHQVSGALATVLLGQRKASPTTTTKPGKAPKGVDYLALDVSRQLLMFAASHPDTLRDLRIPLAAIQRHGPLELRSDLVDEHLYVLSRPALQLLASKPQLSSLKLDLIPLLCRHQLRSSNNSSNNTPPAAPSSTTSTLTPPSISTSAAGTASGSATGSAAAADRAPAAGSSGRGSRLDGYEGGVEGEGKEGGGSSRADDLPGAGYAAMSHSPASSSSRAGAVGVYLVPPGRYCARVNTTTAYGDVNREVAASDTALHLTGLTPSKYDNVVPPSVTLGAKATVGPACVIGEGTSLGDKTSVKRCVIGARCRIGAGVKVINCVLQDDVTVGEGVHLQNCLVCSGCVVQERASLKDCQVGPGFVVAAQSDHKGETLSKT